MRNWYKSGEPWVWTTAGAVALSLIMVYAVVWLTAARGLTHFWPKPVTEVTFQERDGSSSRLIGEIREKQEVSLIRLREQGYEVDTQDLFAERYLFKLGNKDLTGVDFKWFPAPMLGEFTYPKDLLAVERREWGNFYGHLKAVKEAGVVVAEGPAAWDEAQKRLERSNALFREALRIQKGDIGKINFALEKIRLRERGLEISNKLTDAAKAEFAREREAGEAKYLALQGKMDQLRVDIERDSVTVETSDGQLVDIPLAKVADLYMPNAMSVWQKIGFYIHKFTEFVSDDPREANTEGGIFPAIFGTVMMVLLMSVMVTPLGIMAAIYMREYAKPGPVIRAIRISVNNLAGVPSIVYGVFGLGFFVYVLGGSLDELFFAAALPAPTFGSPGILWASLTLAILTLPVVIVATEEGLSRVPRTIREGSLALGATKAETLWRTVLPIASPAMMTGLILAIARAAGEVAPLMLVGVVKLAPSLPLDGNFPFLHLERKFMHLGF
ncbi:MAG: phosphate ABC transporter permease PstA, partial [Thiobacillus sp.]|nr:phosphate ABC transporter permease PstA [Thiobacillus sp.]